MRTKLILPRKDKDGNYYISYSQLSSYNDAKGFNLGTKGSVEYMAKYFFGEDFPDAGWAQFGKDVEDYITERKAGETFKDEEKRVLEKISPLGVFQKEIKLWLFPNIYVLGYIDDALPDFSKIRDYKTASANSKEKYYKENYYQLDIYAAAIEQDLGIIPELEVCIIQRKGNVMGKKNARKDLSVGEMVWYHQRVSSRERIDFIKQEMIKKIYEISNSYKLFLMLNGKLK